MPAFIYNSCPRDSAIGNIDFDTDAFKIMLLGAAYTPNTDTHTKRSDLTSEAAGTGYTAGGLAVTCTVSAVNAGTDNFTLTFAATSWPASTITARYAAVYKSRGGASTADELVCLQDHGSAISSTNGTFTVPSFAITVQNNNP